jgi:hypothetical protein
VNPLWMLAGIPVAIWVAVVAWLWTATVAYSIVGEFFLSRFLRDLYLALLWPLWCWSRR